MGFWDKLKAFFGGRKSEAPAEASDPPAPSVRKPPARGVPPLKWPVSGGGGQFSLPSQSAPFTLQGPLGSFPTSFGIGTGPVPGASPPAGRSRPLDPYEGAEIMALTAEAHRKQALQIVPWRTAFIGRVDLIPPQSDERTALIDRGLVLRGLLTETQLDEIHRVGDAWLLHRGSAWDQRIQAQRVGEAAVKERQAEQVALKAQKKAAAATREAERAAGVARRRASDITFCGAGVSGGLNDRRVHVERLQAKGLPVLASPADLAAALSLTVPRLRWLCYHDDAAETTHYSWFEIPKKSGGVRTIGAPKPELARAQTWVLDSILRKLPVHSAAHGFVPGRSTVTNAAPHIGQDIVVNVDLADFFPSIGFPRVRGYFQGIGYSPAVATLLALLCTESPRQPVELDGEHYWVALTPRALPQGACTSPDISNRLVWKLDQRLTGLARKHGFTYTRYADDLTFSAPPGKREEIGRVLAHIRHIVQEEGFRLNPKKGRVQRSAGRQLVTGLVVNEKVALTREQRRLLRAVRHNVDEKGQGDRYRAERPDFDAWLKGWESYAAMVEKAR